MTDRESGVPPVISHFSLDEMLGSGGMGAVYRGRDRRDGTPVAIKLLHRHLATDASFRERFEKEAHYAALLRSPYTVHLLDFGEEGGYYFIAMEYVEGETVKDLLKSGPLPVDKALRIALSTARALEEAQARGVVHRDIKPENILIRADGAVKVSDFGIARQAGSATLTATGAFIGTLSYAAPEQMLGRRDLDSRADIYALGATLYHMVSGHAPFSGTFEEMFRMVREMPPPQGPLAGITPEIALIINRCLEKSPEDRFQTPSELASAIERALRNLASAESAPTEVAPSTPLGLAAPESAPAAAPEGATLPAGADLTLPADAIARPPPSDVTVPVTREPGAGEAGGPPGITMQLALLRGARWLGGRPQALYVLTVQNGRAIAVDVSLVATSDAGLRIEVPSSLSLEANQPSTVEVVASTAGRRWLGGRRTIPFTISGSAGGGGPPATVSGQFEDIPYPAPLFAGGFLGLAAAGILALFFLFSGGGGDNGNAGVSSATTSPPVSGAVPGPLKVGLVAPYSGALARFGPQMEEAARLAVSEINQAGGVQIELVTVDSEGTEEGGMDGARRLVEEEGVQAIIGEVRGKVTKKLVEQVAAPAGVLVITPGSSFPAVSEAEDGDFLFRLSLSDSAQGVVLAELAEENGWDDACVLYLDDSYGQGVSGAFANAFGAERTRLLPHAIGEQAYDASLEQCADVSGIAAITVDVGGSGAALLRQAGSRSAGAILFSDGLRDPALFEEAGWQNFDGVRGTDHGMIAAPAGEAFDQAFVEQSGESPGVVYLRETYDAVYLLALAAVRARSTEPTAMRDALRPLANPGGRTVGPGSAGFADARRSIGDGENVDYRGASGPLDFDCNGDVVEGAVAVWRIDAANRTFETERVETVRLGDAQTDCP